MSVKILVIGANGFIGKKLMEICGSYECLALVRENINTKVTRHKYVNVTQMQHKDLKIMIKEYRPDVCIDLAWEKITDHSEDMLMKNKETKRDILEIMKEIDIKKIVMCGTCWEYGKKKGELKEEEEGIELGEFGKTKREIYNMSKSIFKTKETKIIWARIFYSYGNGQRRGSLIPYIYKKLKNKEPVELKDKNGANDFIFINDVVKALKLMAVLEIREGVYNIGSGKLTTNRYILNKIDQLLKGGQNKVEEITIKNREEYSWASTKKLMEATGWSAETDIDDGLFQMVKKLEEEDNE